MIRVLFLVGFAGVLSAQPGEKTGENVLLVVNGNDGDSRQVADYYRPRRSVPPGNVCTIKTTSDEEISWDVYEREIERPVGECLIKGKLQEKILYIVLTQGVPLKVKGQGSGLASEASSVDSELALLYSKQKGARYARAGGLSNPFFGKRDAAFTHQRFPIYLVTRLGGFDVADVKAMIDRGLEARLRGKFVVDLAGDSDKPGDDWLRTAAILLPADRVIMDTRTDPLYDQHDVIGYVGWGSNDSHRKRRHLGFDWLPGAIAAEYVSTSARTLKRPPENWNITTWGDRFHYYAGSPQSLVADLIHDGATGASGNAYEPFLQGCARPDYLLPAYFHGRNLAESFYLAIPHLSWMGVVLGDPLCTLGKP